METFNFMKIGIELYRPVRAMLAHRPRAVLRPRHEQAHVRVATFCAYG
jgi:hypothetical protein